LFPGVLAGMIQKKTWMVIVSGVIQINVLTQKQGYIFCLGVSRIVKAFRLGPPVNGRRQRLDHVLKQISGKWPNPQADNQQ